MPHKTKKKFIDKKRAVTFQLVHRSQKDPLAADDEAPQRVLVPVSEDVSELNLAEETPLQREDRLSALRTYGIAFDDDYDYMQHLREPEKQTAILIPKDPRMATEEFLDDQSADVSDITEIQKGGGKSASIKMPSVVFASKDEEEVGMLHRAIPPVGPQVDWDPDVVAALDEDFNLDDPDNVLDDDFVIQAVAGDENGSDYDDGEGYEDDEDCEMNDGESFDSNEGPNDAFFDQFEYEETRSRFTQYSMTSSVIPRNEHLTLLDDQFEKFYETYDDDKIGDLAHVEIDGSVPVTNVSQEEALKMLLGLQDKVEGKQIKEDYTQEINADTRNSDESLSEVDEQDEDEMIELVKEVPAEKWDCESILSTYSNIYNHPKIIDDLPKPIKLSKKTGIPLDTLPTRGLTAKQLRILDLQNSEEARVHTISESSNATCNNSARRKGETKEEKAARKQAVKEMRRERRAEKKATKVAFKQEHIRQHKELLNVQNNLSGVKIS